MLIKKEGIFSNLESYEIIDIDTENPKVKFKAPNDEDGNEQVITIIPTSEVDLLLYKDLEANTMEKISQLNYQNNIKNITYVPSPSKYEFITDDDNIYRGHFTINEQNPITVSYQEEKQNLPVIVSDTQPDSD